MWIGTQKMSETPLLAVLVMYLVAYGDLPLEVLPLVYPSTCPKLRSSYLSIPWPKNWKQKCFKILVMFRLIVVTNISWTYRPWRRAHWSLRRIQDLCLSCLLRSRTLASLSPRGKEKSETQFPPPAFTVRLPGGWKKQMATWKDPQCDWQSLASCLPI